MLPSELDSLLDNDHKIINEVLFSLAKRGALDKNREYRLKGNLEKLISIYNQKDFRHKYSMLYLSLTRIEQSSQMTLDDLMAGLQALSEYAQGLPDKTKGATFLPKFSKLYDHIDLEIRHIKYLGEVQSRSQIEREEQFRGIKERMEKESEKAIVKIASVEKKLDSAQKDHIAILGIFAAIIMTSFASFSLPSAIFATIDKSNFFLLIVVVCFVVLFVMNILHSLYEFLKDMHFGEQREKTQWTPIFMLNIFVGILIIILLYRA